MTTMRKGGAAWGGNGRLAEGSIRSILQDVCRRFAEAVATPYIGERRSGIGVARIILQVHYVDPGLRAVVRAVTRKLCTDMFGSSPSRRRTARPASAWRGGHGLWANPPGPLPRAADGPEERAGRWSRMPARSAIFPAVGRLGVEGTVRSLPPLPWISSTRWTPSLIASDFEPGQLADAAARVGKDGQQRPVSGASRRGDVLFRSGKADGRSGASRSRRQPPGTVLLFCRRGRGRSRDEIAVGRIGAA